MFEFNWGNGMICRKRWQRSVLLLGVACVAAAAASPTGAVAAARYPDLRTLPPYELHLGTAFVNGQNHYVVRFSNDVWNAGTGPFELHGSPHFPADGLLDANQWIYEDPAGVEIQRVGTFAFHSSHQHFHFDGFARFELWRERDYTRAAAAGFASGAPMYTSAKVSFCMLDLRHVEREKGPPRAFYRTCTPVMQGISAGWADIYDYLLPDQWVDVGQQPLPDGKYVMRSIADPENVIFESPGKADASRESQVANSAATSFTILNGRLAPSA